MTDPIDRIADAVLAVPGVTALGDDPESPSDPIDPRVSGVATDGITTSVHVRVAATASTREVAEQVQQVAHDIAGGRVDVTVEEVR
ncbi:hypothetical protein [Williamsia phyllosphaerae]|uniref:Asp23/Gls24 family envelope stress response protein n=1 Tax=Williamsia phyllosphaerae TaxID=885042 RepID=A0ABQ1UTI4_9NOCA|nr:hypothetical protein [Williamsia phyllosphaerae]GGF25832.1 hypothetical protein GCM10007298_22110 [Williamsia phyllosphaerae]